MTIYPSWYEFPLGTFRTEDLNVAPSRGEEHEACDTARLYKDTMSECKMEFGDPGIRAPTQQELKISERFAAYDSLDIDMVAQIDERDEQRCKLKYYRSAR